MAAPKISEQNSLSQLTEDRGLEPQSILLPDFNSPRGEPLGLADGFIDYLAEVSNDGLSAFSLQHLGEASQCALALKRKFSDLVDSIVDQREAERAAATRSAADGHYRRQKVLTREMAQAIWDLAESRIQHLVLSKLAGLARQLPTERRPARNLIGPISKKPPKEAIRTTEGPETAQDQIKELVDRRVTEVLADPDDFAFGGWFRGRVRSNEIRRHQSTDDRALWTRYFDAWGCVSCGAKDAAYGGCGFCYNCYVRTKRRIDTIGKAQHVGSSSSAASAR
jgi:hypothetical protein